MGPVRPTAGPDGDRSSRVGTAVDVRESPASVRGERCESWLLARAVGFGPRAELGRPRCSPKLKEVPRVATEENWPVSCLAASIDEERGVDPADAWFGGLAAADT